MPHDLDPAPTPDYWYMYSVYCDGASACVVTCAEGGGRGIVYEIFRAPWGSHAYEKTGADCVTDEETTTVEEITDSVRETVYEEVGVPSVHVQPDGGKTIVEFPTIVWAQDFDGDSFDVTQPVPGTATIEKPTYDWRFSDGAAATGAGRAYDGTHPRKHPDYYVQNVFHQTGPASAHLTTTWRATFHARGSQPFRLDPIVQQDESSFTVVESRGALAD